MTVEELYALSSYSNATWGRPAGQDCPACGKIAYGVLCDRCTKRYTPDRALVPGEPGWKRVVPIAKTRG